MSLSPNDAAVAGDVEMIVVNGSYWTSPLRVATASV